MLRICRVRYHVLRPHLTCVEPSVLHACAGAAGAVTCTVVQELHHIALPIVHARVLKHRAVKLRQDKLTHAAAGEQRSLMGSSHCRKAGGPTSQ